jgi:2-iminobutanoate/2-iminopropanoate deaminase
MKNIIVLLAVLVGGCGIRKQVIYSDNAPAPVGPYSQGIVSGNTLFVSGQIGLNPAGELDSTTIENECRQALENIRSIVEASGMRMKHVAKSTIYLTDLRNYTLVNAVYQSYFQTDQPARETVEVKRLPKGAHIEISVIARK